MVGWLLGVLGWGGGILAFSVLSKPSSAIFRLLKDFFLEKFCGGCSCSSTSSSFCDRVKQIQLFKSSDLSLEFDNKILNP